MRLRIPHTAPLALVIAISALAGALAPLAAQAAQPGAGAAIDIPFTRYVLPNGLTLIVHEDHKAPIVAVNVWYHVGSKNERPGRTGFAHLFEHLMFNGSENYNQDLLRAAAAGGGDRPQRHHQRGPHQLLPERPRERARSGAVARVRPHGPPAWRDHPGATRRAARRGPEREAAERERAVRAGVGIPQSPASTRRTTPTPGA